MAEPTRDPGQEALDWILNNSRWTSDYRPDAPDKIREVREALDDSQSALGMILRHYAAGYARSNKENLVERLRGIRDTCRKALGMKP